MNGFDYHRPATLEEAWRLRREREGARFIAGGTDLLIQIRKGAVPAPEAMISLRWIPELQGVTAGESFRIGAMTVLADLLEQRELGAAFPALMAAARTLGSPQVRAVATVGGNFCNASPCANLPPPLLVYGARLEIVSPRGTREVPVEAFFRGPGKSCLDPDEIVAAVILDRPPPPGGALFLRKGRVEMDLALASVAVRLAMDGDRCVQARIAAGAVAPKPLRLTGVETLLEGRAVTGELLDQVRREAAAEVLPISDVRASADYRRHVVGVFVRRAVAELARPPGGAAP